MATQLAPTLAGRFTLVEALAAGGEGQIFRARDERSGELVVIKLVPARDAAARARLLSEFERLAALEHPSLPGVVEIGEHRELGVEAVFMAIELIDGPDAAQACAAVEGPARAALVARVLSDAASALEALHSRGLVHHDVKPVHLVAAPDGHFRLIDLGLVRPVGGSDGSVRGTLAYLSPEALAGAADPAVDLFALGVSAHELLMGALPFVARGPAELLAAQAAPRSRVDGPAALVSLVEALLALDPARRPSRALLVAEELARAGLARARALGQRSTRGLEGVAFVAHEAGRGATLGALAEAVDAAPLVLLVGPPGSGRSRLVSELDRRRALAALRAGAKRPLLLGPSLTDAAEQLGLRVSSDRVALRGRVLDRLIGAEGLLHLDRVDLAELRALYTALSARTDREGPARLLVELDETAADQLVAQLGPEARLRRVDVPPLRDEEVAAICAGVLDDATPALGALAARISRGSPRLLGGLLHAAQARAQLRSMEVGLEDLRAVRVDSLEDELGRVIAGLPAQARSVLGALALLDRAVGIDELAPLGGDSPARALAALSQERLVAWRRGRVALEGAVIGRAALAALSDEERTRLGELLLGAADAAGALLDAARLARSLTREDAAARAATALRAWLDGDPRAGLGPSLSEALALAEGVPGPLGARLTGELLLAAADYPRAVATLRAVTVRGAARAPTQLLLARALRAAGERAEATELAERLAHGTDDTAPLARILLGRLRLDAGEPARAREALVEVEEPSDEAWGRAELHEVRGVAALQLGALDEARRAFLRLQQLQVRAPAARRARVDALLGMVAQTEGTLEAAAEAYARALAGAEEGGDLHGAAVYAQNLGGTLRELGDHARALPALERASEVLARVGRDEERALALYNLGGVQLALGDLDAAERAASQATASESALARGYAALLGADVLRRRGEAHAALARLDGLAGEQGALALLAHAGRAELLAELALPEAGAALTALRAAAAEATPALALHAALAEARACFATNEAAVLPEALRARIAEAARAAESSARRELALRTRVLLLRDAVRRGARNELPALIASARAHHEEIRMRTPELRRAALAEDPDVRRLAALLDGAERSAEDSAPMRRLIEINKRLNSELDLDRLLELILDTVIELSRAERGFLLLRAVDGSLEIRLERNIDAAARAGAAEFSRSIAERAVTEGEPIVTIDAAGDRRFEAALSVVDLRLRSVLAVPLQVKGRIVGCVYVDHRVRVGLFKPGDVALVVDLAEQAAIAIENARLLADNRTKAAQVRELNAALEQRLASQTVELEGMHREVREARRSLGVRHDYTGLIGQTPRMVELFRLLDRVSDTALPVVIHGESGTGKELVARAIHHNGPRRKAAFVSESCAAIPETLLEAALFGHVRGAFTGAQGERRGLFEIADGGTLFLDEVGEMSPGMQVRLLRVLQEGEFRRVGGEKQLKVDVRVLVASNRDLGRMVEEGSFREDLYYRLNVVRVALPPLRERAADIPLLVEHLLAQRPEAQGITRRALDRLMAYAWPGNVRQLENELARAGSMADGPIDLEDLSPQVQAGTDAAAVDGPEPLDLHARVERLERGLLTEALARSGGNQSEAARLLGLSRFGLQKKLRRYRMRATPAKPARAKRR